MKKFSIKHLSKEQKETRKRILNLAFEANHSHIGSCLSSVDIIHAIYKTKKDNEKFVLSNGHAGIGLYVILKKFGKIKNPEKIKKLHIHPDRNISLGIHVSTGSLGQGLPIALGMAIANKNEKVYCVISDGECAEGSIWETLRVIQENNISNLKIIVDANGWGGYDPVFLKPLVKRIKGFGFNIINVNGHNLKEISNALKVKPKNKKPAIIFALTSVNQFPFLKDQHAHYHIMSEDDYKKAMNLLGYNNNNL